MTYVPYECDQLCKNIWAPYLSVSMQAPTCFMTNLMPTIPHRNNELTLCLAIACSTTGEPLNGTVLYTLPLMMGLHCRRLANDQCQHCHGRVMASIVRLTSEADLHAGNLRYAALCLYGSMSRQACL